MELLGFLQTNYLITKNLSVELKLRKYIKVAEVLLKVQ